jgi:hypothetical protein
MDEDLNIRTLENQTDMQEMKTQAEIMQHELETRPKATLCMGLVKE